MKQMYTFLVLCIACWTGIPAPSVAQTDYPRRSDGAYLKVEQVPVFPGNAEQYLSLQTERDKQVQRYGLEGRIPVEFIVDKKGKAKHIQVSLQADPRLAKAVRKAVKNMPRWRPGYIGSQAVNVVYTGVVNVGQRFDMPENQVLTGTWQQCHGTSIRNGKHTPHGLIQRFKELQSDGSFRNIDLRRQGAIAREVGTFYVKDNEHYVENVANSPNTSLRGLSLSLTYKFLANDFITITYRLPGYSSHVFREYWKRIR